jgi:hypothetical protein
MSRAVPWYIKAVLYVAIPAACAAALYLSIPGEIALAKTAGWSHRYAPAMPVCLSVYAAAAGAISGYRKALKLPGQKTALIGGVMALALAMSAQSISHLIEQGYMETSAKLVVAVSCIPPLVIAHLIHMAETPSQAKSATEELEEHRGLVEYLTTALVASEAGSVLTYASQVRVKVERVTGEVTDLSEDTGRLTVELEEALTEAEKASEEKRKALVASREAIERTRKQLERAGTERVTVAKICKTLGISSATYHRHMAV